MSHKRKTWAMPGWRIVRDREGTGKRMRGALGSVLRIARIIPSAESPWVASATLPNERRVTEPLKDWMRGQHREGQRGLRTWGTID